MPQQRVETPFSSQTKADLIELVNTAVDELATLGDGSYILYLCVDACGDSFYSVSHNSDSTILKGNVSTYINAIPCAALSGTLTIVYNYS